MRLMDRKYRLIRVEKRTPKDYRVEENSGWKFYQLQALRDIPEHNVKAGDLGGFVTKKDQLSHDGSCWVGGEAEVYGNVTIKDSVYIGDTASVGGRTYWVHLSGEARITGNSRVRVVNWRNKERASHAMFIKNNVHIFGNAWVENAANLSDNVKVYDDARIFGCEKLTGDTEIFGEAKLMPRVKVLGNSKVYGKARINEDAVIVGSEICGSAIVQAYENATGVYIDAPANQTVLSLTAGKGASAVESKPKLSAALKIYQEILDNVASYETDIVKILKYPVMTDRTDPFTREMIMSVNDAKRLLDEPDSDEFKSAVKLMESSFLAAESNALKIASTSLSEVEKKKTEKARDLLAIASNEGSSEQEKKVSFRQAFKQLEGVLVVPERAVDAFRIKIGLPELEV